MQPMFDWVLLRKVGYSSHSSLQYFPRLILSWLTLIILRLYVINSRLDFVSFDNKNLQRQCKFAGEHDFPVQNSLMDRVQCLSLNRDQKFVVFIFCLVL